MTDEKRRPRPAAQYGPTAAAVAGNVKRLREARNLTIYALSGALGVAGRPVTPSAVAKIEKQQRQVTVDDLAALATVFNVSPAALLLPMSDEEEIEVTGAGAVRASVAWAWANSQRPLKLTPGHEETELLEYQLYGLPLRVRNARQHPAGRALAAVQQDVERLIDSSRLVLEGDTRFEENLDAARVALERLASEVNRVAVDHNEWARELGVWKADVVKRGKKKGASDGPSVD
ncbi:helix-turn-helix domain-containing protein [Streptomyces sp. Ju416(a)]|uniref:helix-turn-helix domain-containing protein n=1 Tax=Streptomyces sp. Ju416(a) TaxID=3446591 RepID=UPI00403DBCD5